MKKYPVTNTDNFEGTFPIRLELRIKNSLLVKARENLGYTQKKAAQEIGISPQSLSGYESMKRYPSIETKKKICDYYRNMGSFLFEDDVFPEQLQLVQNHPPKYVKEAYIRKNEFIIDSDIDPDSLPSPVINQETGCYNKDLLEQTRRVLVTLTPREEKVLRMRFGIGEGEHSYEEAGYVFSVVKERIRQIEAKALKKLRHTTRSRKLKKFILDK